MKSDPPKRNVADKVVKAIPLVLVGVPLSALIGVGSVLLMIGSGMTAGSGGGGGLVVCISGVILFLLFWVCGIWWVFKKDEPTK
jgi:hypothetical protein